MGPELSAPLPGGNPPAAAGALRGRERFNVLRLICVIAVWVGVLVRLYSGSTLWLDETLSVNISALPVSGLFDALRHDGSPPFFYLLLHGWMDLFGTSDLAVRSLSTLVSLAALPAGYQLGRRLGGREAGLAAVVLLATNPFLIRYATETRMYSLIVLLVLVGALLTVRAVATPTLGRLWPVALTAGLLSLTHYWTIFLLIAAVVTLGVLGFRNDQRVYWRPAGAILAGQILFLPWVPAFLYQARNTGTPWAPSAQLTDVVLAIRDWSGGPRWFAWPLAAALVALLVSAFRPKAPTAVRALAWCAASGLVIGLIASGVAHAGYASRYTSPSIALVLVLCGVRMSRLDRLSVRLRPCWSRPWDSR